MNGRRKYLGCNTIIGTRCHVFDAGGSIEVDEISMSEIERTRVYFDDVEAMTYHRYRGVGFLLFTGLFTALFAFIWIIMAAGDAQGAWIPFAIFGTPFLLAFILRLILRVDVITIYGRRTVARIRFGFRKARARRIFEDLARRIRARQEEVAAAAAPPALPAPEEPPPPPAEPVV